MKLQASQQAGLQFRQVLAVFTMVFMLGFPPACGELFITLFLTECPNFLNKMLSQCSISVLGDELCVVTNEPYMADALSLRHKRLIETISYVNLVSNLKMTRITILGIDAKYSLPVQELVTDTKIRVNGILLH